MQYMGSKARIANDLLSVILKDRTLDQWYVEPFVGGANTMDKVGGNRIGGDGNQYIISMWKALIGGWIPPDVITREEFDSYRERPHMYPSHLIGFAGVACTFGAKWFGSFMHGVHNANHSLRTSNSVLNQIDKLMGVDFRHSLYHDLVIPDNSIVYCDPPYQGTAGYQVGIDHAAFWEWVRGLSVSGHRVFVSEYSAPPDFVCVKEVELLCRLNNKHGGISRRELLFQYRG